MSNTMLMIIEEESVIALDLAQRLSSMGYQVLAAVAYSEDAVKLAEKHHPDLIVMNFRLRGGFSGPEVAKKFGSQLGIPVIFLTACADAQTLQGIRDADSYGFLLKPFEDRDLFASIETALIRRQWEKQLQKREEHLSRTLRSIGDAVIVTDRESKITFMNPVAERLTGWDRSEAINVPIAQVFDILCLQEGSRVESPVIAAIRTADSVASSNYVLLARDGNRHDVEAIAAPIVDDSGNIGGSVLIFKDIRDRVAMERLLIQAKEKYLSLIDGVSDGFIVADEVGTITFANASCAKMFGLGRPEALLGRQLEEFLEAGLPGVPRTLAEVFRQPEFYGLLEVSTRHQPDQAPKIIEMRPSAVLAEGRLVGTQVLLRDITQRKASERELAQYRSHLEQLVVKRTEELAESTAKLRKAEKMESVGLLASGVAQDLKSIISPLAGYVELLLIPLSPRDQLKAPIEKILEFANRAESMLNDMLTLARRGQAEFEPVCINGLVRQYLQSSAYDELSRNSPDVKVVVNLDDVLPNVPGSQHQLPRAIATLIATAFESVQGHGEITVSTQCISLVKLSDGYEIERPGPYVCLRVSDTGAGLSPQDIKRLFEPYYSRSGRGSGSGLELAVLYSTIKDHDGFYDVQSSPNAGTVFSVYLPVSRKTDADIAQEHWKHGSGAKILVVDGSSEQRQVTGALLTQLGYSVQCVGSAQDAIESTKLNRVELLVLDMDFNEDLDGCSIYSEIVKYRPGLKAVIVSDEPRSDRVMRVQSLGAGPCITKPLSLESLARAVIGTLASKEQLQNLEGKSLGLERMPAGYGIDPLRGQDHHSKLSIEKSKSNTTDHSFR